MEKKKVFFHMVLHPLKGWIRVGNAYPSSQAAAEWLPITRGAWRGFRARVSQCTLRFENGKLSEKSRQLLDQKFNIEA